MVFKHNLCIKECIQYSGLPTGIISMYSKLLYTWQEPHNHADFSEISWCQNFLIKQKSVATAIISTNGCKHSQMFVYICHCICSALNNIMYCIWIHHNQNIDWSLFLLTSRIVSSDGAVWFNDGMTTRRQCEEDGDLETMSSRKLMKCRGKKLMLAI